MTLVNMALFYTYAQPHPENAVLCAHEALEAVSRYTEIVPRAKKISELANKVLAHWEEEDGT
jgi:hypothetical protein